MKFTAPLLIFISLLLFSCSNNQSEQKAYNKKFERFKSEEIGANTVQELQVDNDNHIILKLDEKFENTLALSEVIDSVWYLKLQQDKDFPIGQITNLIHHQDKFFIFDQTTKSVFIYNESGALENLINSVGKGPGEYIMPLAFTVDKFTNEIILCDDRMSKAMYYDLKGNFLREIPIMYRFSQMEVLNDSSYVLHTHKRYNDHIPEIENYQIVIVDKDWKLKHKGKRYNLKQRRANIIGNTNFTNNGQLLYFPPLGNDIYAVNEGKLHLSYNLDFGAKQLPENFDVDISIDDFLKLYHNNPDYVYMMGDFQDMEDVLFLKLTQNKTMIYAFFSKSSNQLIGGKQIFNDMQSFGFSPPIGSIANNTLISEIPPYVLVQNKRELKNTVTRKDMLEIINTVKRNDNPILCFYKLRAF